MKKHRLIANCLLFAMAFSMGFSTSTFAQNEINLEVSPNELADKMINYSVLKEKKGEDFCWHARVGMDKFVYNYELTKNTAWLDAGIRYYDFLIGKMETGPDGYKGWIGPYMYDNKYWIDSHVGDALLLTGMLDFAILVHDDKNLRRRYSAKAKQYTDIAK